MARRSQRAPHATRIHSLSPFGLHHGRAAKRSGATPAPMLRPASQGPKVAEPEFPSAAVPSDRMGATPQPVNIAPCASVRPRTLDPSSPGPISANSRYGPERWRWRRPLPPAVSTESCWRVSAGLRPMSRDGPRLLDLNCAVALGGLERPAEHHMWHLAAVVWTARRCAAGQRCSLPDTGSGGRPDRNRVCTAHVMQVHEVLTPAIP